MRHDAHTEPSAIQRSAAQPSARNPLGETQDSDVVSSAHRSRPARRGRLVLRIAAVVGVLAALGGCAVYPAGYGYGQAYYGGPPVYINGSVNYSDGYRALPPRSGYYGPRGGWRR